MHSICFRGPYMIINDLATSSAYNKKTPGSKAPLFRIPRLEELPSLIKLCEGRFCLHCSMSSRDVATRISFNADMHARHDLMIKSACLWLENVKPFQYRIHAGAQPHAEQAEGRRLQLPAHLQAARPQPPGLRARSQTPQRCVETSVTLMHIRR